MSKHPSRRRFLSTSAAAAAIGAGPGVKVLSAQAPAATAADEVTLALDNGRIHTSDANDTVVNTVVIRNGRFVVVGGAAPTAAANVRVIDLKGRTVVPGVIEPHIHSVSLGNRPGYHTILENTTSIREIQEALATRRKDAPEGGWITSMGGWHPNQRAEHRHPTLFERFTGPCATTVSERSSSTRRTPGRKLIPPS